MLRRWSTWLVVMMLWTGAARADDDGFVFVDTGADDSSDQAVVVQYEEELAPPMAESMGPVYEDGYEGSYESGYVDSYAPYENVEGVDYGGIYGGCESCMSCGPCGTGYPPGPRFWVKSDYVLWWVQGNYTPPLVTSSPLGVTQDVAGVLGQPNTSVEIGDGRLDEDGHSGFRLRAGWWCNDARTFGIESHWVYLNEDAEHFTRVSDGDPALARPFYNVEPGFNVQASEVIAFEDPGTGNIRVGAVCVDQETDIQSAGFLLRHALKRGCNYKVDLLYGYRYFTVDEGLQISTASQFVEVNTGPIAVGTTFEVFDRFETENTFHGGEIGLSAEVDLYRFNLELLGKVALGQVTQDLRISGGERVTVPGGGVTEYQRGLLAQFSNFTDSSDDQYAVLPEFGATLNYAFGRNLQASVGYTFIYLSDVLRPADQIDSAVNAEYLDTPPPNPDTVSPMRPRPQRNSEDIWIQGLNIGVTLLY